MKVTRTDLDKASFKVVKTVYQLEQIERAYPGIEEETEDLGLTIDGEPYNYEKLIGEVVDDVDNRITALWKLYRMGMALHHIYQYSSPNGKEDIPECKGHGISQDRHSAICFFL